MTSVTTVITPQRVGSRNWRLVLPGIGAAVICSALFLIGLPVADTVQLVGLAAGGATLVAVVTALAWRSLGSVRGLLVLAALVPVAATVVGAATAAWLMFLSEPPGRRPWTSAGVSWWPGSATTCARRSPGSGP